MTDVGLGELIVRMLVSLAIVLAIVFGAYALLRHRPGLGTGGSGSSRRSSRAGGPGSGKRGLRQVGRIGVSRTSSVVAVQFADRVLLVGASDHKAPIVLAELPLDDWARATEAPEESIPLPATGRGPSDTGRSRPSFIESLREATTRRG